MPASPGVKRFTMGIPREYGRSSQFAFWFATPEKRLMTTVYGLGCVANMKRHRPSGRILVEISDDHDPDEAWHWIRAELEEAVNFVELDAIWEDAIKWIL